MIGSTAAVFWGLASMLVLLLAGAWLDLLWEFSPPLRIATLAVAGAAGVGLIGALIVVSVRAGRDASVARRVDRAVGGGGDVLTGLELDRPSPGPSGAKTSSVTAGLARMAVDHAAIVAGRVAPSQAAPAKPLGRSLGTLALLSSVVGLLVLCLPQFARTQWDRFAYPFDDVPPFSQTTFEVTPGDTEVRYGDELEIRAVVSGPPIDRAELVLMHDDGQEEVVPMFPESSGNWRAVLAKVTSPAVYYVRSHRARSERYRIAVITVPRIENVVVRITPPPYTREEFYEGPMPADGVAGLPGTEVRIWAASNRPLSGGVIAITGNEPGEGTRDEGRGARDEGEEKREEGEGKSEEGLEANDGQSEPSDQTSGSSHPSPLAPNPSSLAPHPSSLVPHPSLDMYPTADDAMKAEGKFTIHADGKFELWVIDTAGQRSQESFSGTITVLADHRPFIRLMRPDKTSLATPDVVLPVVIAAEDDYGISRVQIYRSLNDSRPLPLEVTVSEEQPREVYQQVDLPLADYGLEPGDVIKLFGRVEDNDNYPEGVKGSESSVVTVRIISQEEFERMLQVRQGLEVLMSKYQAARRRMTALAEEAEGLRKKTEELPPDSPLDPEIRKRTEQLLERLRKESQEIRKSARHVLPYDLDKNLTPQLERLAKIPEDVAAEIQKLLDQSDLDHEALARQLEKATRQLASEYERFDKEALEALEHLASIFPLIADQSRFVMLVLRQKDLAERLSALKGRDGEDNPVLKTRMRDLEQEQRQIREELGTLLDDIEDHVTRLPEDPRLEKLRETATKFVQDVRASGASEAMGEAEVGLAEFSGTRGYEKAQEAADILSRFLSDCQSMGNCAGGCLVFQPTLGNCLGNTVGQLLAQMGMGMGTGMGGMGSGMGGFSIRGGNVGLYGSLPGIGAAADDGFGGGRSSDDPSGDYAAGRANPDRRTLSDSSVGPTAAGISAVGVPVRYRRRAAEYFQRITEALGDR